MSCASFEDGHDTTELLQRPHSSVTFDTPAQQPAQFSVFPAAMTLFCSKVETGCLLQNYFFGNDY